MEGVNWRSWSVADRVAATYVMLVRLADDQQLRVLYEMVGDVEALAALDRKLMAQPAQVEAQTPGVRRG